MFRDLFQRFQLLHNQPGDPSGGGPAPAPSSPAPSPAPPAPAPSSAATGGSGGGQPGGPAARPSSDDRSDWIPPYRYNELQTKAQRLEAIQRENELLQNRLRVMAGLEPQPQVDPRSEQIKGAMLEIMPELRDVVGSKAELAELLEFVKAGGLKQLNNLQENFYGRHAHTVARSAVDKWAGVVGKKVNELPAGTVDMIANNLNLFIQQDPSGERYRRFSWGDESVMDEFIGQMRSMFVDPVRVQSTMTAAQQVETNRGLPTQGPAGAPAGSGEPPTKLRGKELREAARQHMLGNRASA